MHRPASLPKAPAHEAVLAPLRVQTSRIWVTLADSPAADFVDGVSYKYFDSREDERLQINFGATPEDSITHNQLGQLFRAFD